jgi:hypothetical protein
MIRQPQHDYDDGSPIDAREQIATHRGDYSHDLKFAVRVADADCRPPHNANAPYSKRYALPHDRRKRSCIRRRDGARS